MVPLVGIIEIIAVGKAFGKHASVMLINQSINQSHKHKMTFVYRRLQYWTAALNRIK